MTSEHEFRQAVIHIGEALREKLRTTYAHPNPTINTLAGFEALASILGSSAHLQGLTLEQVQKAVAHAYAGVPGPLRVAAKLVPRG